MNKKIKAQTHKWESVRQTANPFFLPKSKEQNSEV